MTALRRLCLAALALFVLAAPGRVRAQDIRVSGDDQSRAAQVVREILARGNYVRFDRDTVLPATFHAAGDVVIYDAEVRLEGTIDGAVAVLGGHFFLRPRSKVGGPIAVLGGDVYTSALATTGEVLYPAPGARVALPDDSLAADTAEYAVTVIPPRKPRAVTFLPRPFPSYDRVNGVTLSIGARLLPTRSDSGPRVDVWGQYRFENPDPVGGGVRGSVPLGAQNLWLTAEASRATRTNDAWQRGDLSNAAAVATTGRDYRDYYDANRVLVMVSRPLGKPLIQGESWLGPRAGVQWEDARSLEARDVWSIWDGRDKGRVNPPILEGTLVSAFAGTELHWVGRLSSFHGGVQVEHGFGGDIDVDFTQVVGEGTYLTTAFRTHQVRVYFRGMTAPGSDAPPQRFAILGGPASLPTLRIGHFRGDHLAYVDSRYGIPFNQIQIPYIGAPTLELIHLAGAAWTGDSPRWVRNVGLGLKFTLVGIEVLVDPSEHPLEPKLNFSLAIPRF